MEQDIPYINNGQIDFNLTYNLKEDKNLYNENVFELKGDNIVKKNSSLVLKL